MVSYLSLTFQGHSRLNVRTQKRKPLGTFLLMLNSRPNHGPRKHYYPDISMHVMSMLVAYIDAMATTKVWSHQTLRILEISLPFEETWLN